VSNVRNQYGLPCFVSINRFTCDTDAEIELVKKKMAPHGVPVLLANHWAEGGKGATDVAKAVVELVEKGENRFKFVYEDDLTLWDKIKTIATKIYGASDVTADAKVRGQIRRLQDEGSGRYPVCVAKTQYSFSTDAALRGAPSGHVVNIREVRLAAGAEFVVMVCGDIMTMPGLPKVPSAERIDLTEDGKVIGLF
jgi:formate--tetrahydrofolate ligase